MGHIRYIFEYLFIHATFPGLTVGVRMAVEGDSIRPNSRQNAQVEASLGNACYRKDIKQASIG
jgi:hypothetical protein